MFAVAIGEMFDAVSFYGPFDDFDAAADYGDRIHGNWWVIQLNPPD